MAKKRNKKNAQNVRMSEDDNRLPQNIISMGERVEEDKNIYISQPIYRTIHRFTEGKTTNESGGILVGSIIEEFGKTNIVICGFIEAKHCEATPTTLKFTHETWEYFHKEIDKKYPGKKIVGWIHTHPNFGIFLSEYDKFIQENFFKEDYEIAYVIDPMQGIEGFYFWINGKIERCKGFYIFDKTGTKISIDRAEDRRSDSNTPRRSSAVQNAAIAVLAVAVMILLVLLVKQNEKTEILESKQEAIILNTNQSMYILQQQILNLQNQLEAVIEENEIIKNELIKNEKSDSPGTDDSSIQNQEEESAQENTEEITP